MNIVLSMDKAYFEKAHSYISSLNKYFKGNKYLLGIGFQPDVEGWTCAGMNMHELKTFKSGWPGNRDFYVCAEGGEFLNVFHFKDDDIIIHTDADMLMQREMNKKEVKAIQNLKTGEVGGSYNSPYPVTLREEFWRMRATSYKRIREKHYPKEWIFPTFCAGVIVARADTYKQIYKHYIGNKEQMFTAFDHHAAGQFHLNYYVHNYMKFVDLGFSFHNGTWFLDTEAEVRGGVLVYDGEPVLFNHTKFEGKWL